MDPTGGWGLLILLGVIGAIILLWIFAPFEWALWSSVGLLVAFVALMIYVFKNARFT
jgi:uncharacterized membrane protein YeaQ/YmgE (transglycosylase-associated protein family)